MFLSKVNPQKKIKLLTCNECIQIISNSKKVLLNTIDKGGSSIRDFKNTDGIKGGFQDSFNVYQREGMNCKRLNCSGKIKKKVIIMPILETINRIQRTTKLKVKKISRINY